MICAAKWLGCDLSLLSRTKKGQSWEMEVQEVGNQKSKQATCGVWPQNLLVFWSFLLAKSMEYAISPHMKGWEMSVEKFELQFKTHFKTDRLQWTNMIIILKIVYANVIDCFLLY